MFYKYISISSIYMERNIDYRFNVTDKNTFPFII